MRIKRINLIENSSQTIDLYDYKIINSNMFTYVENGVFTKVEYDKDNVIIDVGSGSKLIVSLLNKTIYKSYTEYGQLEFTVKGKNISISEMMLDIEYEIYSQNSIVAHHIIKYDFEMR